MSRTITSALDTALTADSYEPFFAIDLEFDTQPLYLWTGYGSVTINSKTYVGVGNLVSVSSVEETSDISVRGATLQITGISSDALSLALNEPYQGRTATVYFGVLNDTSTYTEVFTGFMDKMDIAEGADSSLIELSIENKLVDLERPRANRFTSSHQKTRFPCDLGLDFLESLQDKEISWGKGTNNSTPPVAAGTQAPILTSPRV